MSPAHSSDEHENKASDDLHGWSLPWQSWSGGYAAVLLCEGRRKEVSGGCRRTTNNRMEIMAAIAGLEALKQRSSVKIHTDSRYLQDSISLGWAQRWRAKEWKKGDGKRPSWDLWARLLDLCARHDAEFVWVRGHAGDTENERCDFLSVQAAQAKDLPADSGYEESPAPASLFDLPTTD